MSEPDSNVLGFVERQRIFLRNPLPPGPHICPVCRGGKSDRWNLCYPCKQHRHASSGRVADAVVPVSYAIKEQQHAHNLAWYKATPPAEFARISLASLTYVFIDKHLKCLVAAAGGPPTHLGTVPSTRARPGPHPLNILISPLLPFSPLPVTADPVAPAHRR